MPKYALVMRQVGEGCDYTIGCGTAMEMLKATTREDALVEARLLVQGTPDPDHPAGFADSRLHDHDDHQLKTATLVQIEEELPLAAWQTEVMETWRRREADAKQAKEKAEYERLRAKFGET
jgi:hypothetical protein